jgi:hypothetical protein
MRNGDYGYGVQAWFQGFPKEALFTDGEWRGWAAMQMDATPQERRQRQGAQEERFDKQCANEGAIPC